MCICIVNEYESGMEWKEMRMEEMSGNGMCSDRVFEMKCMW